MSLIAGKLASVKATSGNPLWMQFEPINDLTAYIYQIADPTKRLISRAQTVYVWDAITTKNASTGTNTTTIKITNHGLTNNDLIYNLTRSAMRAVVVTDANTLTMDAISGQAAGDSITLFSVVPKENYTINYLNGKITFNYVALSPVITAYYRTQSTIATAHEFTLGKGCDVSDVTRFGDSYKRKLPSQKYAYGTLSRWDVIDTYFADALTVGAPVVLELSSGAVGEETKKLWALFDKDEIKAAVEGAQDATVSFISTDDYIF